MKKIIIVCFIFSIVYLTNIFGQGKAVETGVEVTNTAEITGDTKEAKTIKVEEQAPGVITEYKEDGTKVVTINLSEVDENKLPEKYEAEVILEAPIIGGYVKGVEELVDKDGNIETKGKDYSPSGTFLLGSSTDGLPSGFDVKIDDKGNIYISDLINSRIQKFDSKGKHIKNIRIKNAIKSKWNKVKGWWDEEHNKNEFAISQNKIYIRDTAKNRIETYDESGNVVETIDIPEKIDGKDTREMKMWADEEGVGVGEKVFKKENGIWGIKEKRGKEKISKKLIEIKYPKTKKERLSINNVNLQIQATDEILSITQMYIDKYENSYFSINSKPGKHDGFFKISKDGRLLSKIRTWIYWLSEEWKNGCDSVGWIYGTKNLFVDGTGNIYLVQSICCKNDKCISKIRIIKLTPNKGK